MDDIERFIRGFARFQKHYYGARHPLFDSLREGQKPSTLVIGCCDSRVDPALLTDSAPGDMFVVRNIANLVPPCTPDAPPGVSSAIEFAVCNLEVERVIVLGHAKCGGIGALLNPRQLAPETDFVGRWMKIAEPVRRRVESEHCDHDERRRACEQASILNSLDNLLTYPWIAQRVEQGVLKLHGWYFDMENGSLMAYSARQQRFLPMVGSLDGRHAA
ncbi:MAG TPA: carbonic anhydrase [Telluria sp.]|nr:carbonic anhydrase [Telluria sp.]